MTESAYRFAERLARIVVALGILAFVAACGGSVNGAAPANDPSRITILPSTATLYAGQPTTFTISGGTGVYIISSSNQAVIPLSGSYGPQVTVVPNQVSVDTDVTLTVRDTGTTPLASATATVKPGTINNEITITPSSTQGTICPTGTLCSGGDALVTLTLSQGGIVLPGRLVRFDAISGDFRFITSATGSPEALSTSTTVITDEAGRATVRIRAIADAPNQTAILQATDVSSGASRRVSFVIAQATGTSPGFFVTPTTTTFQGAFTDRCADTSISSTFYIFGGVPPYTVSSTTSAFSVGPTFVSSSGGSFAVGPNGTCVQGAPIVVRDSSGRTTTVTVSNILGTTPLPALSVTPQAVTLSSCNSLTTVIATGGTGHYLASSGNGSVMVTQVGNGIFNISRVPVSPATISPVNIGISDGRSTTTVTVSLSGAGAASCPTPPITTSAVRNEVALTDCVNSVQVTLSGGTGSYTATSNSPSISATVSGNVVTIKRTVPSPAVFGNPAVTISDGVSAPVNINVLTSGLGAGVC